MLVVVCKCGRGLQVWIGTRPKLTALAILGNSTKVFESTRLVVWVMSFVEGCDGEAAGMLL